MSTLRTSQISRSSRACGASGSAGKSFDFGKPTPLSGVVERAAPDALKAMRARSRRCPRRERLADEHGHHRAFGTFYLTGHCRAAWFRRKPAGRRGLSAEPRRRDRKPLPAPTVRVPLRQSVFRPSAPSGRLLCTSSTGFLSPNALNRHAIGDRVQLKFNPDGSVYLHFQHDSPGKDKESNWPPAATGDFNLTMRLPPPPPPPSGRGRCRGRREIIHVPQTRPTKSRRTPAATFRVRSRRRRAPPDRLRC